ncbi:uncharacterized protein BDZ99DRAFT_98001 [Mytilinidion resinicola]|uniref:Uncharacterized protein n=1 Tax=Mytilinidion resinicola TaxID=574789 RepID=A0A6A6YFC2_9PEZI|nr:uncharacterized protein BDZ99DRAFT_98001 [Mytilinidion resinicola]KAF2806567.1 hypothetical protein BDZ99DRAFT_98001 [Mytilinidion resinicola]
MANTGWAVRVSYTLGLVLTPHLVVFGRTSLISVRLSYPLSVFFTKDTLCWLAPHVCSSPVVLKPAYLLRSNTLSPLGRIFPLFLLLASSIAYTMFAVRCFFCFQLSSYLCSPQRLAASFGGSCAPLICKFGQRGSVWDSS